MVAKENLGKKDYDAAISSYLQLLGSVSDSPEINLGVKEAFVELGKKGKGELQIKFAESATKQKSTTESYKFLLAQLADILEITGELDKSQAVRTRFIKEFDSDVLTPNQMFRFARVSLALGNADLAALTFFSIAKKFPRSDLAVAAAIRSGDLFMKLENKKRASEAFVLVGQAEAIKSRGDIFKGIATVYALSGAMKTGLEKQTKALALALGKSPPGERDDIGKHFLAGLYEVIKSYADKEIDEPLSDIPLVQYLKSKPIKIGLIEEAFAVLKSAGDEEYIMAGNFELGRVWAEFERILKDQVPDSKKDKQAITATLKTARQNSDQYFGRVFQMLDGAGGNYALSRSIREGLSAYYPEKFGLTVYPVLSPGI
jgi:tetratricopeptide (TPR) repeat protein